MGNYINEIKVSMTIASTVYSGDDVTNILELEPTLAWKIKNTIEGRGTRLFDDNSWKYTIIENNIIDIEDMLVRIMDTFSGKIDKLNLLSKESYVEISIVGFIYGNSFPLIHFEKEFIQFLSKFNFHIDHDILF